MVGAKDQYQLLFCFLDEINVLVDGVCRPPIPGFLGPYAFVPALE
jgi:hypothetical protein